MDTIEFDPAKALEAVAYVASHAGTDLYSTLKLLYLADKLHLERYGRLITGDWYTALEYGPVPSHAYDILKFVRGDRLTSLAINAREVLRVDTATNSITALRSPDLDELSRSDISCLDEAIANYRNLSFQEIKDLTHDSAYRDTARNNKISLEAIAKTTKRADELIEHLKDQYPGE